jgi:hypothetical protein
MKKRSVIKAMALAGVSSTSLSSFAIQSSEGWKNKCGTRQDLQSYWV